MFILIFGQIENRRCRICKITYNKKNLKLARLVLSVNSGRNGFTKSTPGLESGGGEHPRLRRHGRRSGQDDQGERAGKGKVWPAAGDEDHADHRTPPQHRHAARSLHGKRWELTWTSTSVSTMISFNTNVGIFTLYVGLKSVLVGTY
jgi:hypothetical protein